MKKEIEKDIQRLGVQWVNPNLLTLLESTLIPIKTNDVSYRQGLNLLRDRRLKPATIFDLLQWSEWDGHSQVVATGTIIEHEGESYVPCLCEVFFSEPESYYSERRLSLLNINLEWKGNNIFLGVENNKVKLKN